MNYICVHLLEVSHRTRDYIEIAPIIFKWIDTTQINWYVFIYQHLMIDKLHSTIDKVFLSIFIGEIEQKLWIAIYTKVNQTDDVLNLDENLPRY